MRTNNVVLVGHMVSVYFIGLVAGQIPVGLLLDRIQTKHVFGLFFTMTALGLLITGFSNTVSALIIGRFLMGLGASVPFLSMLKANSEHFDLEKLMLVNGITLFVGGFGAFIVSRQLDMFLGYFSWKVSNLILCVTCMIMVLAVQLFSPTLKEKIRRGNLKTQVFETLAVLTDKRMLFFCALVIIPYAYYALILSLWISPWLESINGMNSSQESSYLFIISLGCILGPLLMGYIGYLVKIRNCAKLIIFANTVLILIQLIALTGILHIHCMVWLWVLFMLVGQSATLGFAYVCTIVEEKYIGSSMALLNLALFLLFFIFKFIYGAIVRFLGIQYPNTASLKITFGLFLIIQIIVIIGYVMLRLPRTKPLYKIRPS
jgi:predicted MFS family arabinose efflux permease